MSLGFFELRLKFLGHTSPPPPTTPGPRCQMKNHYFNIIEFHWYILESLMSDSKTPFNAFQTSIYRFSLPITNLDLRVTKIGCYKKKFQNSKNNSPPPPSNCGFGWNNGCFLTFGLRKARKKLEENQKTLVKKNM